MAALTNYDCLCNTSCSKRWTWLTVLVGVMASVKMVSANPQIKTQKSSEFTFLHAQQAQFAKDLSQYEITIPQRVTKQGDFVSHSVHHILTPQRQKRDTRDLYTHLSVNPSLKNSSQAFQPVLPYKDSLNSDSQKLHYVLTVNNKDLHLELEPNHQLIAPGLVIERRPDGYKNLSHARITDYPLNRCHFVGHVKGDPESKVALGTCHGLHGFVHTSHGHYLIEPVKGHNYTEGGHHPHLVYNRAALPSHMDILRLNENQLNDKENERPCGVDETIKNSEKERETWEKQQNQAQKKAKDNKNSKETDSHSRKKRSISRERYVEVMVVVDREMTEFYKDEDVQTYVLTIMNMVSVMYHDSTIGNSINVVLVNLMLMEYDEEKLKITHHADNTLRSFCKWQKSINVKEDSDPNHHDVAVLLTRRNICSKRNEPCSTLGLSQVNGLCQPHRSCNINEDTGLALAYTVAHELGHNFGMQHDGAQSGCEAEEGKFQLVMAAQLNADASPMIWSNCSKEAVTKFLDRDWGYCLDDIPAEHDYYVDERPAGIKYDANHQCRLQYGEDAQYCEGIDNLCMTLWCRVQNKCMTRLEAAAEGTICGDNEWCSGGRCVMQGETPLAQNGEWGEWGSWSECSRSCGAGVSYRQRHCDNPGPKNGGKYCLGERKRYRICNTDVCPEGMRNFKDMQCSHYDNIPYKGKYYQWQYVVNPRTPCQLHCRPKGHFFSVMLSDMVLDGTSCSIKGPRAMCISGLCRAVGCDWDIDSEAIEDGCGVCRGDGATCKTIKTKFNKEQGMGYVEAMVIPEGARNIRIEEVAEANNYLAIKNDEGKYYLNGGWFIQWNGDYEAAGTVVTYERVGDKEMLKAPGPLNEDLHIMLLFQSENPGVEFEYTIPNENATDMRQPEFKWIYLDWTHCTHSCGGGTQRSQVLCSETELGIVDDMHCNISTRPEDMLRVCNDHICPPRWWPGPWQHCSVSCGENGIRRRTVLCVRSSGHGVQEALEDWECEDIEKPLSEEACRHKPACPTAGEWQLGPWSDTCKGDPCSTQVRDVYCDNTSLECDESIKPATEQQCHENVVCGLWYTDVWLPCTRSCGGGIQMRSVVCKEGQACNSDQQPTSEKECNIQPCPYNEQSSKRMPSQSYPSDDLAFSDEAEDNIPKNFNHNESSSSSSSSSTLLNGKHEKNERVLDLKPKMKDEFKKENIVYSRAYISTSKKITVSTTVTEPTSILPTTRTSAETVKEEKEPYLNENGEEKVTQSSAEVEIDVESTTQRATDLYMWVPLFWGKCSKKCGTGKKTRPIKCFSKVTLEEDKFINCLGLPKPAESQDCNPEQCLEWNVREWGQCSEICDNGTRSRVVDCPSADMCDPEKKPTEIGNCFVKPCVDWIAGDWGECSKSCDSGHQTRSIQCVDVRTQETSEDCPIKHRPSHLKRCNMQPCPSKNGAQRSWIANTCHSDILSRHVCTALKRMGRCWHNIVQYKCCHTCQTFKRRIAAHRKSAANRKNT